MCAAATTALAARSDSGAVWIAEEAERLCYSGERELARSLLRLWLLANPRCAAAWELLAEAHELDNQRPIADSLRSIARALCPPPGGIVS